MASEKGKGSKRSKALIPRVEALPMQLQDFDIVELEDRLEFTAVADAADVASCNGNCPCPITNTNCPCPPPPK